MKNIKKAFVWLGSVGLISTVAIFGCYPNTGKYLPGEYLLFTPTPTYAGDLRGKTRFEVLMWSSTWDKTPEQAFSKRSFHRLYYTNVPPRRDFRLDSPWFFPYYTGDELEAIAGPAGAAQLCIEYLEKEYGSKLWALSFERIKEDNESWFETHYLRDKERLNELLRAKYWCVFCCFDQSGHSSGWCVEFDEEDRVIEQTKVALPY